MLKHFLIAYCLLLNSCVALAQDDLNLVDFTVATQMPEFELTDMRTGEAYSSLAHPEAAYVIEFFFNSCPACNQNAGNVKRLQNEYRNNPKVQIVELSIDCDSRQYRTWIGNHAPAGPVLNGCDANIVEELGVSRFPTTYIFAPSRREAMRGQGVWRSNTYNSIKRYLDQVK